MKWLFYVIVFVYMFYRAVYGARSMELEVEHVTYGDDGFLKVGEHKTISCKAPNRNQNVEWKYPNGSVVKRIPGNRIFSQEHSAMQLRGRAPVLVLSITKAEVRDSGVYQCRSGEKTKEVSLCVIDPAEFIETKLDVNADIGRSITLSCQAKGNPEPRLEWFRNGNTIADEDSTSKYRVMTKYNIEGFEGLLTILSLEPEDNGVYSCVSIQENTLAENCSHEHTLNITLNVNYAPVFESSNEKNIYGKNNQEVDIVCSAPGFPVPTYRWFKELPDLSLLELDTKQIKFSAESGAILTVTGSSSTFGKKFKCQATNELGTAEQYYTLLKLEKPTKIDEVFVQDFNDKTVQINVTWYSEIEFPVTAFHIQYVQDNNKNRGRMYLKEGAWKDSNLTEMPVIESELQPEGALVTLSDLEADTNYYVRVRAINEAGESPWSKPFQVKTLTENKENTSTPETPAEPEVEEEAEESASNEAEAKESTSATNDANLGETTFYGIFFAGGIFVVAFAFMLSIRMVR